MIGVFFSLGRGRDRDHFFRRVALRDADLGE